MNYFAYGSNMSTRILGQWCSGFAAIGAAQLVDYRLAFTRPSTRWGGGAADVVPEPGQAVWGVLYAIDYDCLLALDRKEGWGVAYEHLNCAVSLGDGTVHHALTYTVIAKTNPDLKPMPAYKDVMLEGAAEHHLPPAYLDFLNAILVATQNPEYGNDSG